MPVVVVAGGLGDMGSLITDALVQTAKHEVYVMSRKASTPFITQLSMIISCLVKSFVLIFLHPGSPECPAADVAHHWQTIHTVHPNRLFIGKRTRQPTHKT